jgi:NADH:ubiquinone oxidoreductase subunit E
MGGGLTVHDLSLYLLELLENSLRAEAQHIWVEFFADRATNRLRLIVEDDGRGLNIDPEKAVDPFFTTKADKKTGLGLSLFRADAEAAGGYLRIGPRSTPASLPLPSSAGPSSTPSGVRVEAEMILDHLDRLPVGDIGRSLTVMAATSPDVVFTVTLAGDLFDPPRIDLSIDAARDPLTRVAQNLDHTSLQESMEFQPGARRSNSMTIDADANKAGGCACGEEISEEECLARLDEVIERYKDKPGALIPVLQTAQAIFGYLPEVALKRIALGLGKPYSEVAGVVSFYSFFSTVPRGKHVIRVCLGTACYVRGGLQVLEAIKEKLGIDVGETTEDRMFTLEVARCFGACGLAPAVSIDDEVHRRVRAARVGQMLAPYYEQEEVIENVAS